MKFPFNREESILSKIQLPSVLVHNSKKEPTIKLQSPRTVKIRPKPGKVEQRKKMVNMEKGVLSMQGKEGNQRWHLDKEDKISCKELVRVDKSTLLWAEILNQEQMTALEDNKDFLIIPTGPVPPLPPPPPPPRDILQFALQKAQVDFDNNNYKSSQSGPRCSVTQ